MPSCHLHTTDFISRVRCSAASRISRVHFPLHSCKDACRTLRSLILCPDIKRFTMVNRMQFYIDGAWVDPVVKKSTPAVNPATQNPTYDFALASRPDLHTAMSPPR